MECSNLLVFSQSLQGELKAIREACLMVMALALKGEVTEADNHHAISLSVSELVPPWEVGALVEDIRESALMGDISFSWVIFHLQIVSPLIWCLFPESVMSLLINDLRQFLTFKKKYY